MHLWAQRQRIINAIVMVVRCGADFENNLAELATSFGAHSAEPCVLRACSCDEKGIVREENGHGFGVDGAVRKNDSQVSESRSPLISNEFDGLAAVTEDVAIDLIADFGWKVDKTESSRRTFFSDA